jgi:hypothetical protein
MLLVERILNFWLNLNVFKQMRIVSWTNLMNLEPVSLTMSQTRILSWSQKRCRKTCSRYSTSKAEFNLEGYDLFPEKFPIQDTKGILVYIKQDLKAVEVNIDQDFKECVLVKVNLRNRDKLLVGCTLYL